MFCTNLISSQAYFTIIILKIQMFFCDFLKYNGLPVYAMRERVNRYEIRFGNMLTLPVTYGKMFLDRKGCGRR